MSAIPSVHHPASSLENALGFITIEITTLGSDALLVWFFVAGSRDSLLWSLAYASGARHTNDDGPIGRGLHLLSQAARLVTWWTGAASLLEQHMGTNLDSIPRVATLEAAFALGSLPFFMPSWVISQYPRASISGFVCWEQLMRRFGSRPRWGIWTLSASYSTHESYNY